VSEPLNSALYGGDKMNFGIIGGLIGGILGLLAGIFGTYCSIKNTNGPKEKSFMIKASIIAWIGIALFLALMFLLPKPYRFYLWIPYAIILPIAIIKGNKIQAKTRQEESNNKKTI
jgi:phosphotransferase system  glucose/maltose/N-acetylglucosamine-specific IIC component